MCIRDRPRDVQRIAQPVDVVDQVRRIIVSQRRGGASGGDIGLALAAAALVEQDDAIARRIEKARHLGRAGAARPAVKNHHRLAARGAIFLPCLLYTSRCV